ncbi:MAG: zinc ribbon domain-containing protein [Chloroflexi bacterium]|nr:zinc ribbon domain-containing protein [Chloroflexota bacterium]
MHSPRHSTRAACVGSGERVLVQIASREWNGSGGQAALTATIAEVADGVSVSLGQHTWLGAAANLVQTGFMVLFNPISLISYLDDIAHDVSGLSLPSQVWEAVDKYCRSAGAALTISERLRAVACAYCGVANSVGTGTCSACGAPLGAVQPRVCTRCGNVLRGSSKFCDNCGNKL